MPSSPLEYRLGVKCTVHRSVGHVNWGCWRTVDLCYETCYCLVCFLYCWRIISYICFLSNISLRNWKFYTQPQTLDWRNIAAILLLNKTSEIQVGHSSTSDGKELHLIWGTDESLNLFYTIGLSSEKLAYQVAIAIQFILCLSLASVWRTRTASKYTHIKASDYCRSCYISPNPVLVLLVPRFRWTPRYQLSDSILFSCWKMDP